MTPKQIIERCSMLGVYDQRSISDDYIEIVFYNKEIEQWSRILADIFGPAVKPPGAEPTEDDLRLTKDYGGIWSEQTLFKKDFNNSTVISMFWPWQDNIHTTLKTALIKKD